MNVDCFVFRITEACDKACSTCCCFRSRDAVDPAALGAKMMEIVRHSQSTGVSPTVVLTGGEPFLYKVRDDQGETHDLVALTAALRAISQTAKIVIKTSGWKRQPTLDRRLQELIPLSGQGGIEVRLGFNLYQKLGQEARERLSHMVRSILRYQPALKIETIYDRENIQETFRVIQDVLSELGTPKSEDLAHLMGRPDGGNRFSIPIRYPNGVSSRRSGPNRLILLESMPAYAGLEADGGSSEQFWDAAWERPCPMIREGPDHILYNPDLSFFHCNDAFAEHACGAFPAGKPGSLRREVSLLTTRFRRLRERIDEERPEFVRKRDQCVYCSKFVHQLGRGRDPAPTLARVEH